MNDCMTNESLRWEEDRVREGDGKPFSSLGKNHHGFGPTAASFSREVSSLAHSG